MEHVIILLDFTRMIHLSNGALLGRKGAELLDRMACRLQNLGSKELVMRDRREGVRSSIRGERQATQLRTTPIL